ncbi:AraC family transcriptional regulator [Oerskovia sp. NPDC057915]|uniref:AraC family transcriptional regulator n=1 Tax=Oerskovia sp. NPDC057915 TaxID=3346280 RepID=UPI0036DAAEBA
MPPPDRLAALLDSYRVRSRLFHVGPLCGVTTFAAQPGRGFLHVLRRGEMGISHQTGGRLSEPRVVDRPTLLLYPQPLEHVFHNAPTEDSDFACATFDVEGGATHPLVRTLPPVLLFPLDEIESLGPSLDLLFAEIDQVRCGQRLVADRLFDVVLVQLFRWMLDHPSDLDLPPGLLNGLSDENLARPLVAIHESPGRRWTVEAMAREARMSRSSFALHFRTTVGESPNEYLTSWRLTVAQNRLRGGTSVARTATEVGYATPAAFSRAFSQRLGRSPRAWLAADGGGGS